MSSLLNVHLPFQVTDGNGKVQSGAKIYVYDAGTTTDAEVYLDSALATQHPQPVVANASGFIPSIYAPAGQEYKVVIRTSADAEIVTLDGLTPYVSNAGGTLPITGGGTGAITAAAARSALATASQADVTALTSTVTSATTAQTQATWEAGVGTGETVISPAKLKAGVKAHESAANGVPDFVIEDQKPEGNDGGASTTTFAQRDLNTVVRNVNSAVTLASNVFTITEQMWVEWMAPGHACREFKSQLVRTSDSAIMKVGTNSRSGTDSPSGSFSQGTVLLDAGSYQIEQRSNFTNNTTGFGLATDFGVETYTIVRGWRVA